MVNVYLDFAPLKTGAITGQWKFSGKELKIQNAEQINDENIIPICALCGEKIITTMDKRFHKVQEETLNHLTIELS
ncbi:MAG: hypothetical protein Q8910_20340 [Bacteroidota bacterium]|nr:hypothetical protein [Bacteroidota bacterium]